MLAKGESLADSYKDHPLVGKWIGFREFIRKIITARTVQKSRSSWAWTCSRTP
ncbi:MAG: hypothetical protein KIG97_03410 [Fibrobacter sp.]|nr:hypothetical protein [Fibrobacter sp.]